MEINGYLLRLLETLIHDTMQASKPLMGFRGPEKEQTLTQVMNLSEYSDKNLLNIRGRTRREM